jgi:hypothetical protein
MEGLQVECVAVSQFIECRFVVTETQDVDSRNIHIFKKFRLDYLIPKKIPVHSPECCFPCYYHNTYKTKQTPWLESESELYQPSDRRLSAKLVPTLVDTGVAWSAQRFPHSR